MVQLDKSMKRLKKSHSWWEESHNNLQNSKWLAENFEEMDRLVKRMLKLVEEEGDSFAKKAEMYYQRRPELIVNIEEFQRLYRSLAERYDHATAELKRNGTSDVPQSPMSSCISEVGSEMSASSSPDVQRLRRHKSGPPRAAGFAFFLGSTGNNSDNSRKEGEESLTSTDVEPESDDDGSSINNYSGVVSNNGGDQGQQKKVIDLENEICELKEKLRLQKGGIPDSSSTGPKIENSEESSAKIAEYAQELKIANEKLQAANEEIARLSIELKQYKPSENGNASEACPESSEHEEAKRHETEPDMEVKEASKVQDPEALVEELRITKDMLRQSHKEIESLRQEIGTYKASSLDHEQESSKASRKINQLQGQLDAANKDGAMWKLKLNSEKKEVLKLQERITRLKASLSDRDQEVRDLKIAVSDAEEKIFPEKAQVKAEIAKLSSERTQLEELIRDWESRGRALEDEIRTIKAGKAEMEEKLTSEIELFKSEVLEISNHIGNLNKVLDVMKAEGDELSAKVVTLRAEVSYRDDQINEMDVQLQQLHKEQAELVAGAKGAGKMVEELTEKTKELEEEVQRQRVKIQEGAEEKREAIRQLCISLEHYRNDYNRLRHACMGQKSMPTLLAS